MEMGGIVMWRSERGRALRVCLLVIERAAAGECNILDMRTLVGRPSIFSRIDVAWTVICRGNPS